MVAATQNIVPTAVSSGRLPPEGARSVRVTVDFSQGSAQVIDLVMMLQRSGMSCIQGAFVNNANGSDSVTIRAASTGQEQTIAAGDQGWINFLSPDFDTLTVSSAGTDTVDFHLLNFPVTPHVWGTSGTVPPGLYVLRAGDTMTGPLAIDNGAASPTEALTVRATSPSRATINIIGNGGTAALIIDRYTNNSVAPNVTTRKSRGSSTSPIVVNNGDQVFSFSGQYWDGATFRQSFAMNCTMVAATPSPTDAESEFNVSLAGPASITVSTRFNIRVSTGMTLLGGVVIDQNRLHKLRVYTVATLPAPAVAGAGATAYVSNALAPAWGVAVAGGGAVGVPVYCDGAVWYAG